MGCADSSAQVLKKNQPLGKKYELLEEKVELLTDVDKICSTMRSLNANKIVFAGLKICTLFVGDSIELQKYRIYILDKDADSPKNITSQMLYSKIEPYALNIAKVDTTQKRDLLKEFLTTNYPKSNRHIFLWQKGNLHLPDGSGAETFVKICSDDKKDYGHDILIILS